MGGIIDFTEESIKGTETSVYCDDCHSDDSWELFLCFDEDAIPYIKFRCACGFEDFMYDIRDLKDQWIEVVKREVKEKINAQSSKNDIESNNC